MKLLTKGEIDVLQQRISLFASFCLDDELAELIERYIEQTRMQRDGSMDAILPHIMSIRDMRKAQANLLYLCGVAQNILDVRRLTKDHLKIEAEYDAVKVSI